MLKPIDRQVAKSWFEYLVEPQLARFTGRKLRRTGPRIAVIGACQSYSLAFAMKLLRPDATVDHFPALLRARVHLDTVARTLATYDHVFSNLFPPGYIPGGGYSELCGLLERTRCVPHIVCGAFHPDCIYVGPEGGPPLFTALGPYHSALALFAYLKGLSVAEANALFNDNVFETLGYFDAWTPAVAHLLLQCRNEGGLDFSNELAAWARRGVFMYTINHPKPFVMIDMARRLLTEAGVETGRFDSEHYMIDDFVEQSRPIFPVYPPIGARYGVSGSYTFRVTRSRVVRDTADYLDLPQFLTSAFEKYGASERSRLVNPRVEAWLADTVTCERLVALARKNLAEGLTPVR
jgi:hypothetical protein